MLRLIEKFQGENEKKKLKRGAIFLDLKDHLYKRKLKDQN